VWGRTWRDKNGEGRECCGSEVWEASVRGLNHIIIAKITFPTQASQCSSPSLARKSLPRRARLPGKAGVCEPTKQLPLPSKVRQANVKELSLPSKGVHIWIRHSVPLGNERNTQDMSPEEPRRQRDMEDTPTKSLETRNPTRPRGT
jgi:hypothetical protein